MSAEGSHASSAIEALYASIEGPPHAGSATRQRQLLDEVLSSHREAFSRVLELTATGSEGFERLRQLTVDPTVAAMLDQHALRQRAAELANRAQDNGELSADERLRAVGEIAAGIVHELRNPIGSIRNAWTFIERRLPPDGLKDQPRVAEMRSLIDRELARCSALLAELLEFSRDRPPHRRPVDIAWLVDDVFGAVSKPAETMRLLNEVPRALAQPNVDSELIRQVLINLVQNGLEAISPLGCVRVFAATEAGGVRIDVSDDGKGMADEVATNIWRPLFTTKKRGTGLGLSIASNIVARHEGTISVETSVGNGTKFRLLLPHREASSQAPDEGGFAGTNLDR
ncbi:MAG: hypothetical protein HOW73_14760 [Polyangiaceae bacterium]|nr:hypothetical protein [Polyangiaceae bacterium]